MKKRYFLLTVFLVILFAISGCGTGNRINVSDIQKDNLSGNRLNSDMPGNASNSDISGNALKDDESWTGIKPHWTYDQNSIGGGGAVMVNLKSGNVVVQHTDVSFPGRGLPVEVRRTYNSQSSHVGVFGNGWTHIFEAKLEIGQDTVKLIDGYGGEFLFTNPVIMANGSIKYTSPPGRNTVFKKRTDGKYQEKKKNGTIYIFDENGKLFKIKHRNKKNYLRFIYNGDGRMVKIKEASGRITKIRYNGDGRIKKIIDPLGREVQYRYNGDKLVKVIDPEGDFVKYSYKNELLKNITNPRGIKSTIIYDEQGRASKFKDPLYTVTYIYKTDRIVVRDTYGHRIRYFLNEHGNCTRVKDTMNFNTHFTWDSNMNITKVRNAKNQVANYIYDSMGNVLSVENSVYTVYYTYDSKHNLISFKNGKGKTANFNYASTDNDSSGVLTSVVTPMGKTTTFLYNGYSQPTSLTDAKNNTTTYYYDTNGSITRVTDAGNNSSEFTYNNVGEVLSAKDALNRTTLFDYDKNGLVKKVTSPLGNSTDFEYDANGNKTKVTDAKNNSTSYAYDDDDRLISVTDALNHTTTYIYENGNLKSTTDPMGFATTMTYDANDRLTARTNPITTESFEYDEIGNTTKKITQTGEISYTYDDINRVTQVSMPEKSASFTYDNNGNILTETSTHNMWCISSFVKSYTYNDDDLLTSKTRTLSGTILEQANYDYDDVGNLLSLQQNLRNGLPPVWETGTTTYSLTYQYDELNRQTQVTNHAGDVFTCDYNAVGNMTAINYPDGTQSAREFDEENRITKVTNDHPFSDPPTTPPHIEYDYTYDEVGNFASVQKTPGDLSPRQYQYDSTYKLTRDESANKDFLYDNAGNKTSESIDAGHFINFSYNNAHQLTRRYASVGAGIPEINYNYDNNGNRRRRNYPDDPFAEESIASFTTTNRLKEVKYYENFMPSSKQINGGERPEDGRRRTENGGRKTEGSRQAGTEYQIDHYAYDGGEELFWSETRGDVVPMGSTDDNDSRANALAKIIRNASPVESSSGKKFLKLPKFDEYTYVFSSSFHGYESGVLLYKKGITGLVEDGVTAPSTWNKIEYYTYLNGMKVGVYIDDDGGLMSPGTAGLYSYYFSYDGQGNVVQVSNKAGELPYHIYAYDSYGSTTEGGGSYEGHLLASYKGYDRGPFGYKTGVRQYDPETGRFLSPDPFKGYMTDPASQHPYMYCQGNPIRYSDPSGYKVTKIEIYYGKKMATIYFDDKKPIYLPVAVASSENKENRIPPGTTMYIVWWNKNKKMDLYGEHISGWFEDKNNPYGPYFATLSTKKEKYENSKDAHIHGTQGETPDNLYDKDSITYTDETNRKRTRAFTHGCTRFNNRAIEMLHKEAPSGTPVTYYK